MICALEVHVCFWVICALEVHVRVFLGLMRSGSDGLVKVWTVRTNECVATLDQHTEKVYIDHYTHTLCSESKVWVLYGGRCGQ